MHSKNKLALGLLTLYLVVGLFVQFHFTHSFKSLPSPLFGGDYYYQLGTIYHIKSGGNPLVSSSMIGGIPGYSVLYPVSVFLFLKIFHLSPIRAMISFSYVLFVLSTILWFILFKEIFRDDFVALTSTLFASAIQFFPVLKYTPFSRQIMLPLFLLFLYRFYKDKSIINSLLLGVFYGLTALSHVVLFVVSTLLLLLFALSDAFDLFKLEPNNKKHARDAKRIGKDLFNLLSKWLLVLAVALPIAFLYWYQPVFVFHLHSFYDRLHMDTPDFHRISVQFSFLFSMVRSFLFNFSSFFYAVRTLLIWLALYAVYDSGDSKRKRFIIRFSVFSILICFSYFVTEPLLRTNFVPSRMNAFTLFPAAIFILAFGLNYFKELLESLDKKKLAETGLIILFFVLLLSTSMASVNSFKTNKWVASAYKPVPQIYASLQKFILNNTSVNDVILSTKELSFVVNSLTGRKLVVNRWAQQNDPYLDLPERDLDAAIILYSNDTNRSLELLKKYNVSYIYWDVNWPRTEYTFQDGKIVGIYDPLLTFYSPQREQELVSNNVSFFRENYWVDPAERRPEIRKYDLLIISYKNYRSQDHPFSYALDKYLKPVWTYRINNKPVAVLYKVNLP